MFTNLLVWLDWLQDKNIDCTLLYLVMKELYFHSQPLASPGKQSRRYGNGYGYGNRDTNRDGDGTGKGIIYNKNYGFGQGIWHGYGNARGNGYGDGLTYGNWDGDGKVYLIMFIKTDMGIPIKLKGKNN